MTETQERGPGAAAVDAWQRWLKDWKMGPDGRFQVELHCLMCGRLLNADGNHPAEIHAGCYNGLCYGCTKAPAYIAEVAVLDGCQRVSWPPSCPSYRRDREKFYGYPGCEACQGMGVGGTSSSLGGGLYRKQCQACLDRYTGHPLRAMDNRYTDMVMRRAQDIYYARLKQEAGVPRRCKYERERDMIAALPKDRCEEIGAPILDRCNRLRAQHYRRVERLQIRKWRPYQPGEFLIGQGAPPPGWKAPLKVQVITRPRQHEYRAEIRNGNIEITGLSERFFCYVTDVLLTEAGGNSVSLLSGGQAGVGRGDTFHVGRL